MTLSADIANAPEGGNPSYSWQMNFGGSWSQWGTNATFSYAAGSAESPAFRVKVSYGSGESATSEPLTVTWVEELPNRAPVVDEDAARYDAFVDTDNAARGTMVYKHFDGIFSDPDGDKLTYTVAVTAGRSDLVVSLVVAKATGLVGIRLENDGDWGDITPALADPLVTTVTLTATDPDGLSASLTGSFRTDWQSHPRVKAAEATASDGSLIIIFDQQLQKSPAPAPGQFTVHTRNADGATATNAVERVSVLSSLVILTLADAPEMGQTLTLDYAHADTAPIKRSADGGDHNPGFTGLVVPVIEGLVTAQQEGTETITRVSNIGQTPNSQTVHVGSAGVFVIRKAMRFTTGNHAAGYTLSEVDISVGSVEAGGTQPLLRIYTRESNAPGELVHTLTAPASFTADAVNTFTAPAGSNLDANTAYFLVFEATARSYQVQDTASTAEDDGAASGWSISDSRLNKTGNASWESQPGILLFAIKGKLATPGPEPERAVTTVDRTKVVVTFNEHLNTGSTPATGAFTVTVNGASRVVSTVNVSGSAVTLTLASPVSSTDLVTVSYDKPATNPLQGSDNEDADSFSDLPVDVSRVLVSNQGQVNGDRGDSTIDYAQGFTTGGSGFKLTGVGVDFPTLPATKGLSVSIRSGLTGASNGTLVGTLTNPGTLADGVNTFTASGDGLDLEPSTVYYVVVDFSGTGNATVQGTASDSEDSGEAAGWSIANNALFTNHGATGWTSLREQSLKIAVHGYGPADYDSDGDGLIEIRAPAQLNALRWDTDGDGTVAAANQGDYDAAFPRATANMGCPDTGCQGYEIGTGDDTETAITINLDVAPYNDASKGGWVPIPSFTTLLEGNAHTIAGLIVAKDGTGAGLFASIASTGGSRT